jgi:outer membrane lipoprotein carrier protein
MQRIFVQFGNVGKTGTLSAALCIGLGLVMTAVPTPAVAAPGKTAVPPLLTEVEKAYAQAGTLFAEFTQTKESAALGTKQTSSGRIALKKPNKVRWETLSPDPNILVSDGVNAWYYTAPFDSSEHGQVTETKAAKIRTQLADALMSGEFSKSNLKITSLDSTHFSLIPKKGTAANVKEAKIAVDPSQKTITLVEIIYDDGNHTEIKLSNIKLGEKLGDDVFVFKAPPNTDHVTQ